MTDDVTCGHCRRPIATASRGWAADKTVLCHTGTLPPDAEPPDCYRLVTIYGHSTNGYCCHGQQAGSNWPGRDTMLTAVAQVGQAVVQLHGPLPEDVAEALRALMVAIQRHQ